jgi:integrase
MGQLNEARIRALKPGTRDRWAGDGNGLWLRVRTSGSKVFILRIRRGGRTKVTTLGEWLPDGQGVTLTRARLEAAKAATDRAGRAVRVEAAPVTVAKLTDEFFARRIQGRWKRTKSPRTYRDRLVRELGWRRVSEVRPTDLAALVKQYAATAPVAANRFLSFAKMVFDYAVVSGQLETNPADKLTTAIAGGEEVPRDRVLTDNELRRLWHAQGEHVRLLRFLLLTGARIGEAQLATWARIDLAGARWHIPAAHAKNARAHWAHLPPLALEVLGTPGEPDALALRSASETAVQAWLRRWCEREGIAPRFTPHDLRRTFATRLGDLGLPPHVIAKMLNHTVDVSGAFAVYARSELEAERVEAARRWAAAVQALVA